MAVGDLCTIADVRDFVQKPVMDVNQDLIVGALIAAASKAICGYCEREFAPTAAATARTFEVELHTVPGFVSFAPHDLQAVSLIEMDPDRSAFTLSSDEYRLFPVNKPDGVWTSARLSPLTYPTSGRVAWPQRQVRVTGDWGFPAVPEDVRQAAVITTSVWLRRDVSAFSTTFNIAEDRLERPEAIPSAARALIESYVRMAY